jgi:GntR family transcriptional regulator
MALWIQISAGSNEPIYGQIVAQVSRAIAKGEVSTGDKLPAVRTLAGELVINPNTVARAYTVLEQQGLVNTKTGSGTFVADPKLRDRDAGKLNILTERMDNIITQGLNIGLRPEEIRGMFETRLKKFGRKADGGKRKK